MDGQITHLGFSKAWHLQDVYQPINHMKARIFLTALPLLLILVAGCLMRKDVTHAPPGKYTDFEIGKTYKLVRFVHVIKPSSAKIMFLAAIQNDQSYEEAMQRKTVLSHEQI